MRIGIFGASGCSRETADICLNIGYQEVCFIEYQTQKNEYFGFKLIDESEIPSLISEGYHFIIGVGNNSLRKKIYNKFPHLQYVNVIHPSATFGYMQMKEIQRKVGNIITAGVRITNNIEFGNFGVYNLNSTVSHDCIIEDFINLASGVNISGNVLLREGAYVGANASVLQGRSINEKLVIGTFSTIGAGSVVVKDVPDGIIVKGVPAR